ncbi:NADPH-dependent 7-cyano-7-deazaguanine reductase QueF [Pseudoalteromonas tunicata]|nr:NADPH-dependent 7-cyano-7-deazaguanine reductase QueF [Pseudoalteromonas tunicata]ATC95228.1 7-cyano-7-deazaguanine reductase [Pseudoalteromonas tunicata]AXT32640.1 NADPH-dependent 7-cyano-7-deazaguanine reductase QueF [Pseudoalteromonas tunicata]MDP4982346.1 NADPH-dependent 7-cyano-7-deazaguanine reductase QueF [Pseudoalteromonas tunicata]MDP5213177.1 NADPH-dependent 7-cyano-7-deazaguanine reductase QueF [Pseudoalteromonas tunicata]
MTDYENSPELKGTLLGQQTEYKDQYDASLLFPIARKLNRDELAIDEAALPFVGEDTWTGYELSWLNAKGKPQVAVAEFIFPCQSSHIIESKSFKLYLNSFNQTRFDTLEQVKQHLVEDLSKGCNAAVEVRIFGPEAFNCINNTPLPGLCIDDLDVEIDCYSLDKQLLKLAANAVQVSETLHSHLLKSNCLITSQPDWASVVIRYSGPQICHESLLRYLISFRSHNEFHEQCVERIYCDIQELLGIKELEVYARYTRRGGLDINPYRSSHQQQTPFKLKINRQ